MGGIPSIVILPPVGPGFEPAAPGPMGEQAFRRISAAQRIPPAREDARACHWRPNPRDSEPSQERDNREVRQFVVHSDFGGLPQPFAGAGIASSHFLVQVLGQRSSAAGPLTHHRGGVALGSEAYRRAGAEPPHYSEQPAFFRVAV